MTTQNTLPISFKGTMLEYSYIPTIFEVEGQKRADVNQIIKYVDVPFHTFQRQFKPYFAFRTNEILNIIKGIISVFRTITGSKELEKTGKQYKEYIESINKDFELYKQLHELSLHNIVNDIDVINRKKTLMKDYLLNELFCKLQELGVESCFENMIVEHIDLRDFPINDTYNAVDQLHLKIERESNDLYKDILALVGGIYTLGIIRWWNRRKTNKILEKTKNLRLYHNLNVEKMNADLDKLDKMHLALDNVAKIYNDVYDTLKPIMETILDELKNKYDNINDMPKNKLECLRKIKDIFKEYSEVTIIPSKSTDSMISDVVDYSNDLSIKHYELKNDILNVAN